MSSEKPKKFDIEDFGKPIDAMSIASPDVQEGVGQEDITRGVRMDMEDVKVIIFSAGQDAGIKPNIGKPLHPVIVPREHPEPVMVEVRGVIVDAMEDERGDVAFQPTPDQWEAMHKKDAKPGWRERLANWFS